MVRVNVKNLDLEGLQELAKSWGQPAFRGAQIFRWLWRSRATSFAEMSDLPKAFRERLEAEAEIPALTIDSCHVAKDGTRKLLIRLPDGEKVESVLIPDADRRTLCVSTQVGCTMGCKFCRTATMGLIRHLQPWEVVEQVLIAESMLTEIGEGRVVSGGRSSRSKVARRLTNLVFMGMGEPLHNIEGTITALKMLTSGEGLDFAPKRITVSTVGLVDRIERLLMETKVRVAISLNAPEDELRAEIMPVNDRHPVSEIIAKVASLPLGRERLTFEYVLLANFNDQPRHARTLARLLEPLGRRVKVNLIPFNPYEGSDFDRPDPGRVEAMRRALVEVGVDAFVRRPRGDDILAACGQLALKDKAGPPASIPV